MFHNVQGVYRAAIALKWFAMESCIQHALIRQKSHCLSRRKCQKYRIICYAKNVENRATFLEGFYPEFYARGRFIKYSMFVIASPWDINGGPDSKRLSL